MKNFIKGIDEEKLKKVFEIKTAYDNKEISIEEAQKQMQEKIKKITPPELAYIEQNLQQEVQDECIREKIDEMLAIYEGLLVWPAEELEKDHPIKTYYNENSAIKKVLEDGSALVGKKFILNPWLEIFEKLYNFRIHTSRKQNQLYTMLEQKGFDRPTKTMWLFDDAIRDEINEGLRKLKENDVEDFDKFYVDFKADILDLIEKEETILFPTSLDMITEDEFRGMRRGDDEIGYCLIDKPTEFLPLPKKQEESGHLGVLASELANLLGKYGYGDKKEEEVLHVSEGQLTLEQINLIFKHLSVDLSFVDENEIVKFYSDTKHRVFPRSSGVIGRDVKNCHPAGSVYIVEEIIDKFRKGEQEQVEFWINKPDLFIYIIYTAVRDEKGNFRGVLEMMQDCTHIRALEGSRTLLTWEDENLDSPEEKKQEKNQEEDKKENTEIETGEILTAETKIKPLFDKYDGLKEYFISLNPAFQALRTPLARIMLPKATLGTASGRSGMPLEDIIEKLNEFIKNYKKK
ncbi:MAG: PAS domain-containing protein [Fusobacterium sp.]|nr:PAS domain-containing protein [Fusobacterium sp.]